MIAWLIAAIICSCGINGPATAYERADRLTPPPAPTTVPVDPCVAAQFEVNTLTYEWGNMEPARQAYRAVASGCLGWTPAQVTRWERFIVDDVIKEESGGCWNLFRKAQWTGIGCNFTYPNGSAEDAGFFQLISIWYGPGAYLCATFGTCGRAAVVASPYTSMVSGLRVIMHDGSRPWCYDSAARRLHSGCSTVTRHWG